MMLPPRVRGLRPRPHRARRAGSAGDACARRPRQPVTVESEEAESIRLRLSAPAGGVLVSSRAFYPGWEGRVDSSRVPALRVNTAFLGLALPSGDHDVRFVFVPRSFYLGLAISALALIAAALAGAVTRVHRHRRLDPDGNRSRRPGLARHSRPPRVRDTPVRGTLWRPRREVHGRRHVHEPRQSHRGLCTAHARLPTHSHTKVFPFAPACTPVKWNCGRTMSAGSVCALGAHCRTRQLGRGPRFAHGASSMSSSAPSCTSRTQANTP